MMEFFLGALCGAGIVMIPVLFLYKRVKVPALPPARVVQMNDCVDCAVESAPKLCNKHKKSRLIYHDGRP
jgi:hypothetical protein